MTRDHQRTLIFSLMVSLTFLLSWPTIMSLGSIWFGSSGRLANAIALPLGLWLIQRRGGFSGTENASFNLSGLMIFLACLVASFAAASAQINLIAQTAFAGAIISAYVAVFGVSHALALAAPLVFIFFLVPIDDLLVPALREIATHSIAFALWATGFERSVDGHMLTTRYGPFAIAQACAGLAYVTTAAMAAFLIAEIRGFGYRQIALFSIAAAALATVMNAVRGYVVIAITTLTNNRFGTAEEHGFVGVILFVPVLAALILLARHFDRASSGRT